MQQEIDEVVAPNFLASPKVIKRKEKKQKVSGTQHIKAELAKPEARVLLNGEQIIEHEWDVEGVPISGKRDGEDDPQYNPECGQMGFSFRSTLLRAHIPILFRNRKMRLWAPSRHGRSFFSPTR